MMMGPSFSMFTIKVQKLRKKYSPTIYYLHKLYSEAIEIQLLVKFDFHP